MIGKDLNVFAVDWGKLAQGPCYPAAVYNARLAGQCSALLVDRIRELGNVDIHVIGFSLGKLFYCPIFSVVMFCFVFQEHTLLILWQTICCHTNYQG